MSARREPHGGRASPRPSGEAALPEVRAGGGAVWRHGPTGGTEILLVHRPRYDDWSLPKGKADPGEDDLATALREVAEETGLACAPGPELASTRYLDRRGRSKVVRYWAMTVAGDEAAVFTPNDEVDELAWIPVHVARARLSYGRDAPVLDALEAILAD